MCRRADAGRNAARECLKGSRQLAGGTLRYASFRAAISCPARCGEAVQGRTGTMSAEQQATAPDQQDSADLAQYGYKQELKRQLGLGSSFAVAFSYISPSTGIFTLFFLGLTT